MWNLYKIIHIPQKTQKISQIELKCGIFKDILLNFSSQNLFLFMLFKLSLMKKEQKKIIKKIKSNIYDLLSNI